MSWARARVAPERTHHVIGGEPLYGERYDEVLSYHAPGLAAVRRGAQAWHIDPSGRPAYPRRFLRCFGFYEGRAAVASGDGWHHIGTDGSDSYAERHAWCGNYQEGRCAVRGAEGRYRHIDLEGRTVGDGGWGYAGDFRGGVAVVQGPEGLSTHVDSSGGLLHGRWFLDLDVFHKGFARAQDDGGWMHVGISGEPAYPRRFRMVEPFYNGQARVERFDGALEVIDEGGATIHVLRPATQSEFASLSADLVGFWRTQAIHAAVEVGLFERLPATAAELAQACGLDDGRTARLLRALGELRLVERAGGRWALSERGEPLRRDHPLTLAGASREYATWMTDAWRSLPEALRRGGEWRAPDVFAAVAADESRTAPHHRMLRSYARHDYPAVVSALALRGGETVLDAGGGVGVLAELLLEAHPAIRVVVLERPEVARAASVPPELRARFEAREADLLEPWPVQGDAVLLARVLHDWDDERAVRILRHARAALSPGGRIFVVEMMLDEETFAGALCDLHLLVVCGGQERTAQQYARLLRRAGFVPGEARRASSLVSVLRAEAR